MWIRPKIANVSVSSSGIAAFQAAIVPAFRQRPSDTHSLGALQIVMNRTLTDRATAGNLALA